MMISKLSLIFITAGAAIGYSISYFSTCSIESGGCFINSSPIISVVWGGLIGFLATPQRKKKERDQK